MCDDCTDHAADPDDRLHRSEGDSGSAADDDDRHRESIDLKEIRKGDLVRWQQLRQKILRLI